MSYHIYTTNGIILKRTPFGEANVLLHVLTEDFGLIIASAQAVRKSSSKLRSAIQEYAHISVSCVKGRNGWKITSVLEKNSFYFDYPKYCHRVMAQMVNVILKMIPGETPHPEIFKTVRAGFEYFDKVSEEKISNFECIIILRILYHLGYIVSNTYTREFLDDTLIWNENLMNRVSIQKKEIITIINKAIEISQL